MKKTAAALCAAAITLITGVAALAASAAESVTAEMPAETYVLRSVDGRIAVESESAPSIETSINVEGLRTYDRELLENGIEIMGYENMLSLLEDFSN